MVISIPQNRICLPKKDIDKLESVGKNGIAIAGDHIRLKSVPTYCINHTSNVMKTQQMDIYIYIQTSLL